MDTSHSFLYFHDILDPDVDVITIEDYINETSQEIKFTEISDDAALQKIPTLSKLLHNYKTHKCSKCLIILKKQIEEEKQRQAIQELNEHHNYSKPSCLSLQADSKDVYIWAPRFSSGIPIVVDESLSPNRQISPVVNESLSTNRDISPFIENQAIPSVRQCSWSMENCTNRQRRKNLKELIQERQNLEILIRQNWKATKTSRVTIPNNLEHVFGSTPIETINKLSRNNDIDRESLPTPTPKKIVTIIRSTNHNVLERESRRKMADLFTGLKHSIPKYSDKKQSIPKIKILQEAEKYIISLTKESSDLEHEKEKLQRQNFLLNEYLKHCHSEDVITVLPLT